MKKANHNLFLILIFLTFCATAQKQNDKTINSILNWPANYVHCNPTNPTVIVDVNNPITGKTWMDRNLGANRAAISSTDSQAYGSLFQWGRGADGHQCVNRYVGDGVTTSSTTSTLSNSDSPGHGNFIEFYSITSINNWLSIENTNLWQGANGVNNPCPIGYRVPTDAELTTEIDSWSTGNIAGAFASPLKLTPAGYRNHYGQLTDVNTYGEYWSYNVESTDSKNISFNSTEAGWSFNNRVLGFSVRCIKNSVLELDDFDSLKTTILIKNKLIKIFSNQTINRIEVFDINSRCVLNYKTNEITPSLSLPFNQTEGIYIVKVYLNNEQIITKKLFAN